MGVCKNTAKQGQNKGSVELSGFGIWARGSDYWEGSLDPWNHWNGRGRKRGGKGWERHDDGLGRIGKEGGKRGKAKEDDSTHPRRGSPLHDSVGAIAEWLRRRE